MNITVYCSVDNAKLLGVDAGEDYLIPFPENDKHPIVQHNFLNKLLDDIESSSHSNNVTILTHSSSVINIVVGWLEKNQTLNFTNFKAVILTEEEQVSTLYEEDGGYYLQNWQIGFLSVP